MFNLIFFLVYALKVLDSFGVAPKSFNWGNYFWFAPQWQCNDLNTPYVIAMSADYLRTYRFNPFNVTSPVRLRLTMVYMRFSTPRYIDVRLPYEVNRMCSINLFYLNSIFVCSPVRKYVSIELLCIFV